jgi:hypothetical protein
MQAAVDAATPGDVIKVAAGTYTDIHSRAGVTQVVYISKSVTIRGGYTTSDWTSPNPEANPTTLDARGLGRSVVISGTITPTVQGLRITGGDASGLGGGWGGHDAGGGLYLHKAAATIIGCVVYSNTASRASVGLGGGAFLVYSDATLIGNTVHSNTASTADWSHGGGLYLYRSNALLSHNTVVGNISSKAGNGYGGGLDVCDSAATLNANTVQSNTASTADRGWGGGLEFSYSDNVTLSGNTVQGNTASTSTDGRGGGLDLYRSDVTLNGNVIQGNVASTYGGRGGGLNLSESSITLNGNKILSNTAGTASGGSGGGLHGYASSLTMVNNMVADNHANTTGSGLYLYGGVATWARTTGRLLHNTIADNHGSGQGVYVGDYTTLTFTNAIIAGHHSVGIIATITGTVTLEATLWHENGSDTSGDGTIVTGTVNVYGEPAFVDPHNHDYHIGPGSAALEKGVDAGVITDIDNEPRFYGDPDLGADEYWPPGALKRIYLPLVVRNESTQQVGWVERSETHHSAKEQ